jgi:hypothetical protein
MSSNNTDYFVERREFIKRAAVGAGAVAMGMVAMGCSSGSGSPATVATPTGVPAGVPTANAWKFGVMADTQWIAADDGLNPNTSAAGLYTQLQKQFINQKVKFVIQVGDLTDQAQGPATTTMEPGYPNPVAATVCEDTRALFAQALYNAGIGFFPVRGNHDDIVPQEFINIFPQTQNGQMNKTPAAVYGIANPDANQPSPAAAGSAFTIGGNFASIGSPTNYLGLSYGFDFLNARFILIDQFTPNNTLAAGAAAGPDGNAYSLGTTASLQQGWLNQVMPGKPSGGHLFLFTHKGIILQQHIDVLFGDCPADADFNAGANAGTGAAAKTYHVAAGAANIFIRSMVANNARYLFCGHDHNHTRCLVNTTDTATNPVSQITQVLCQSVSSKFYTPNELDSVGNSNVPAATSNDSYFCAGNRQIMLSQELYTVGYYIVTVDGQNVVVDYYSAPVFPAYNSPTENVISETVALSFTKRETFGYSLNGKSVLVPGGGSYAGISDAGPSGTVATINAGTNTNENTDFTGRRYQNVVNTGWVKETATTASDILSLLGMERTMGVPQTDTFALSMTYDSTKGSRFVLATPDANGNWTNAVNQNTGGATALVTGPWKSTYGLGTYGIDSTAGTVWAVLNFNGCFAAVASV